MKFSLQSKYIGDIPILEVTVDRLRNKPLPTIIFYHGWQMTKKLVLTQGRRLAAKGFRVVLPDSKHHGERYQAMSLVPSLAFWQTIQANLFEFEFIVKHYQKRQLILNDRLGVGGISMGGMTTAALLTHHSEIKTAACVMGTPDLLAYQNYLQQALIDYDRFVPSDYSHLLSWVSYYNLATQPGKLGDRPLFIWHGRQDERVPFESVEQFVKNNPQFNLTFSPAEAPHFVDLPVMDEVADFFGNYL